VVDNFSSDKTIDIAKEYTEKVYTKGPKRASQLNYGVKIAKGKYVFYPDADMIISKKVIIECVEKCEKMNYVGLYIPEVIIGKGYWIKVRNFERSYYNTTCIDAVRFIRRDKFLDVDGFDEYIEFGADDWDFNRRIQTKGKLDIITSNIYHNERDFNINTYLNKKKYYSKNIDRYIKKWGKNDSIIKKQLGMDYRLFWVFIENGKWKILLKHPDLSIGMYFLRVMVGLNYILVKKGFYKG